MQKGIASFLLLLTSTSVFQGVMASGLTSGAYAPEYTSFEPVDTDSMVNKLTGDFVYNLPLMEVPGPEGGYPLSLSNHGGVKLDQESSWVGLGWSLNPGAIVRTVDGFPDDFKMKSRKTLDYWQGGKTDYVNVSASTAGVGLGVTVSNDTYKGKDVETSMTVGYSKKFGNATIGASMKVSSKGVKPSISAGYKLSDKKAKIGKKLGVKTDFNSVKASFKASYEGTEASIDTKGKFSVSSDKPKLVLPKGETNTTGSIKTSQSSWGLIIPLKAVTISIAKGYLRYWKNSQLNASIFGALYPAQAAHGWDHNSPWVPELRSFDSYLDHQLDENIIEHPDPTWVEGASFPAYDTYVVTGQGVGGVMQPHIFDNPTLFRQNTKNEDGDLETQYRIYRTTDKKVNFRFLNENGNSMTTDADLFDWYNLSASGGVEAAQNGLAPDLTYHPDFYNEDDQHLAGSQHVEWFSMKEITMENEDGSPYNGESALSRGLILADYDYQNEIQMKKNRLDNIPYGTVTTDQVVDVDLNYELSPVFNVGSQIAAFTITNESGVNYHYAIPVYAYEELIKQTATDKEGKSLIKQTQNDDAYAYTWLLTSVTGPNFVDRNRNGIADDDDWGYWVNFNYGKWTDELKWRTPDNLNGTFKDVDDFFNTMARGSKQLYYLNSVETRSHEALFVKSMRKDGKGVISNNGGYEPFHVDYSRTIDYTTAVSEFNEYTASPMKLDKIILIQKDRLAEVLDQEGIDRDDIAELSVSPYVTVHDFEATYNNPCTQTSPWDNSCTGSGGLTSLFKFEKQNDPHLWENVLDQGDLAGPLGNELIAQSSEVIELNTDYSLCPGTDNSFDNDMYYGQDLSVATSNEEGKLTLKSVDILGAGGVQVSPAIEFGYGDEIATLNAAMGPNWNGYLGSNPGWSATRSEHRMLSFGPGLVEAGDIIRINKNNLDYYALIVEERPAGVNPFSEYFDVLFFGPAGVLSYEAAIQVNSAVITKNPPYLRGYSDLWGYFKSDFSEDESQSNNVKKRPTRLSSHSTDSWSLRRVKNPLGSELLIAYQADEISNITMRNNEYFNLESVERETTQNYVKLKFHDLELQRDEVYFEEGNTVDIVLHLTWDGHVIFNVQGAFGSVFEYDDVEIETIDSDGVVVYCPDLYEVLEDGLQDHNMYADGFPRPEGTVGSQFWSTSEARLAAGGISLPHEFTYYGGGVRTSAIKVVGDGKILETKYEYLDPLSGKSSGTSTFIPDYVNALQEIETPGATEFHRKRYKQKALDHFNDKLQLARHLPSPEPNYSHVQVSQFVNGHQNKIVEEFEYQVATEEDFVIDMIDGGNEKRVNKYKDYSSRIGLLKAVNTYTKEGVLLQKMENRYAHDSKDWQEYESYLHENYADQGVVQQEFHEYRIRKSGSEDHHKFITSVREKYPTFLEEVVQHDYVQGTTSHEINHAFDFITGMVTKLITFDTYGNAYMFEKTPAYQIKRNANDNMYPELGPKIFDENNRNMLTQTGIETERRVDPNDFDISFGIIASVVQLWSDLWEYELYNRETNAYENRYANDDMLGSDWWVGHTNQDERVWRKKKKYTYVPVTRSADGTGQDFMSFDWSNSSANTDIWQPSWEASRYDQYGRLIESKDINGQYHSERMNGDNSLLIAKCNYSTYENMRYAGAEDVVEPEGGVKFYESGLKGTVNITDELSHTGRSCARIEPNKYAFTANLPIHDKNHDVAFMTSAWLHKDDYEKIIYSFSYRDQNNQIVGSSYKWATQLEKHQFGDWYRLGLKIPSAVDLGIEDEAVNLNVTMKNHSSASGPAHADDFRVHPQGATMVSYSYDELNRMEYAIDENNLYKRFEYDPAGNLTAVFIETPNGEVKISELEKSFCKLQ